MKPNGHICDSFVKALNVEVYKFGKNSSFVRSHGLIRLGKPRENSRWENLGKKPQQDWLSEPGLMHRTPYSEGPLLGLVLPCHHPEILITFETGHLCLCFALGPTTLVAGPGSQGDRIRRPDQCTLPGRGEQGACCPGSQRPSYPGLGIVSLLFTYFICAMRRKTTFNDFSD